MNEIAVVGLGKAGLPIASVIADSGLNVVGIDVDKNKCEMINNGINPIPEETGLNELIARLGGERLIATSSYSVKCNVYIVIVPLFIDQNNLPDFSILLEALRNVGRVLQKGDLVVLETTVPPRTTETLIKKTLEDESKLKLGEFYLAHSPERIMTGYSISRLKEFPKIIGGVDRESGERAYEVYSKFIPNLYKVSSARLAEFVKVIEGCYRDVNVALSNELMKISDELKIDFFEAIEAANHDYCHIHLPSTGVGGHCIPVYPWFLINEMERRELNEKARLLRTARELNDGMIEYWVDRIIEECLNVDKPLKDIKICVRGITFREGVKELYHSRNLEIVRRLMSKGLNVSVIDDMFSDDELIEMGLKKCEEEADIVFDSFLPGIV